MRTMAFLLLLLLATSVAVQAKDPVAPPKPTPKPTPTPTSPTPAPTPPAPAQPCAGYECPDYEVIDTLEGGIETRRYGPGMWVKYPVPGDDFIFMAEYGNEKLGNFFDGHNYEHKVVKRSTPLRIQLDLWNEVTPRNSYAGYFISAGEQTTAPAPVPPTELDTHKEVYVFAKKFNTSEGASYETVSKAAAAAMIDLTMGRKPFNRETVYLAMYSFPKEAGGERQEDEIWITRTLPVYEAEDSAKMLRSAGRNATKVLDYVQRRLLR